MRQRAGCAEAGAQALALRNRFAAARDDIDDAAGGAESVGRHRAANDLDALDAGRRDRAQLLGDRAQRRGLRHAVDEDEEITAAQLLPEVGQALRARPQARHGVGEDFAEIGRDPALRDQLLALDDGDAAWDGGLRPPAAAARRGNGDRGQRRGLVATLGGLGAFGLRCGGKDGDQVQTGRQQAGCCAHEHSRFGHGITASDRSACRAARAAHRSRRWTWAAGRRSRWAARPADSSH